MRVLYHAQQGCAAQYSVATRGLSPLWMGLVREPRSLKRMGCMRAVSSSDMSSSAGKGRTLWKSTLDTRAQASTISGSSSSLLPCNHNMSHQALTPMQCTLHNVLTS